MSFSGSRLKKFDVHVKLVDGVSQQTSLGAVMTILCFIFTVLLCISEINLLLRPERSSHMVLDQMNVSEPVKLHFKIEFAKLKCSSLSFSQEVVRGTVHEFKDDVDQEDAKIDLFDNDAGGCHVNGLVITDKVAGNFRFKVAPSNANNNFNLLQAPHSMNYPGLDLSHTVHNIWFEGKQDVMQRLFGRKERTATPLQRQTSTLDSETGLYHYGLQIVPSIQKRDGEVTTASLNDYYVAERKVALVDLNRGMSLGGSIVQNFVGVIVTYDFYPVAVVSERKTRGLLQFAVSLCAIVGGLVTVMSLIDKCLYSSIKVLIGKKD